MSWVLVAAGAGAGVGVGKSELVDRPREERQRKLAAQTQRYSPWTGLQAQPIQEAKPFDSALQYGGTGAMMASGINNQQAQTDWLNRGGSPQYPGAQTWGRFGPSATPPSSQYNLGDYGSKFQYPDFGS